MTDHDTRYSLRLREQTTVTLPDRRLRVVGGDDHLPSLRAPETLRFGDVELQIERDGDQVVVWVVGMPLLTGSLDEAARLAEALGSIIGRP